ncbi:MAG TPA: dynamin family protein [Polyangia bacterium]|nr:dynamin family protein [Polyangia bacterium]
MSAIAGSHLTIKKSLIVALSQTAKLAASVGMDTLAHELSGTRIPKLEEERFALVVLGEFNHGKSTFVNALCGAAILPAGITPTTATINHLVYSDKPTAVAYLTDDKTKKVDPKALGDWVTIEGKEVSHVRYVEIGWPAEILRDKVTLVDTPGVNDINEQRAEITYSYIPRADAVLFLLDGAQVLKQSERAFLEQRILRRSKDKLIFVLGKIDLLAPDEREQALAYCRENLAKIIPEPVIFPISAKRALDKDPAQQIASGLAPLRAYLGRYLAEERGRILLDNGIADGLRTAGYLRQNLGIKRRSLGLALDELEERIARVRAQLDGTRAHLKAHHAKIRAEADAIKAGVRLDLEEWVRELGERLPEEIDRADAEDVKRYLQLFLQDTWKEWAEQEGEKVAERLERLAEEIIQVTNENVAEAMATLAKELGPADTRIDLEVDTLKYDVGVFALGALGTGIFLFVNTLVGGLLTLAAPILAVVVKGRVSGAIKTQAKEGVPEVNQKAAQAVGPRFEQIVEDFQGRLADFVTAAGDTLHRGISEVLDRALAERRAQGVDVAVRQQELDEQLRQLAAIDERLEALRVELWGSSTESTGSPTSSAT